jgi:peptide-methionine (R)-S-oxide reductase
MPTLALPRRAFLLGLAAVACAPAPAASAPPSSRKFPVMKTDAEWRKILNAQQFHVLREKGTERAFTGASWNEHRKGTYVCAGCQSALFSSETKFESGTGWPSFFAPITDKAVAVERDSSQGMIRDEVVCATCGGHLGHVFDDGPLSHQGKKATGLRYCMNSISMQFMEDASTPRKD